MLSHLTIRSLAVIDSLELDCTQGMTALTGETGAGKSIVVDALALLLGARANPDMIRIGADRAEVCAIFETTASSSARAWLAHRELEEGMGECLVRRVVGPREPLAGLHQPSSGTRAPAARAGGTPRRHSRPARASPLAPPRPAASHRRRLRRPPRSARAGLRHGGTVAGVAARDCRTRGGRRGPHFQARFSALPARTSWKG